MSITAEAREFRDAIDEWAKGYAATGRLAVRGETRDTAAESDLRRWSHRRFSRPAAPDPSAFPILPVDISSWLGREPGTRVLGSPR